MILLTPVKTDYVKKAVKLCVKNSISFLQTTAIKSSFSVEEIRTFYEANDVHIWCESNDIVYVNNNYLSVYAVEGGEKIIKLDGSYKAEQLFGNVSFTGGEMKLALNKGQTVLFKLTQISKLQEQH